MASPDSISKSRNYGNKCAVCGISEPEFLVAGHISRWPDDPLNRLNPANGICLCSLHDKAFEHGYIGIDDVHQLMVDSKRIHSGSALSTLLNGIEGKKIFVPKRDKPDVNLLKIHRLRNGLE